MALVLQVFGDGQLEVETACLKDDANLLAHLVRLARNVEALDSGAACGRRHQRGQNAKQRGLAAAVGAEQAEDLRSVKFKAEAVEGEELSIAVGQALEHNRGNCGRSWDCGLRRGLTERSHGHFPVALSIITVSSSGR